MWPWLKNLFARFRGPSLHEQQWDRYRASGRYENIRAKYDAALTDPTNYRHWANADHLSAVGANNLGVRQTLRSRSRYECTNNCHARGVTLTLANDIIGVGARLQVLNEDENFCDAIETPWNQWADEIGLNESMHTLVLATITDGEGPGMLVNNRSLSCPVKLDVRAFECDLLTSPFNVMIRFNMQVDGIQFDEFGNPSSYHVLKTHPGDTSFFTTVAADYETIDARNILHWFREDRPGQRRGIPWTTPALPIFSQMRRLDMATLAAAEIAADFAMFISTDAPADGTPVSNAPAGWDVTNIDKGMLTALPEGYKPFQLTPTQPTTGHHEFTKGLLRQAYAALGVPYNIGNADFEGDSYAGGRMGLQVYQRALKVHRQNLNARIYNKIFAAWFAEAILIPGYLKVPSSMAGIKASDIQHTWHYSPWGHVDPVKEATATGIDLANGTTTLADECAEEGKDYRRVIKQQGIEKKLKMAAGIWVDPSQPTTNPTQTKSDKTAETGVAA